MFVRPKRDATGGRPQAFDPGTVVPVEEAIRIVRSIAHQTGTETIPIDEADGRTLNATLFAPDDVPGFDRASRDGYAIIAADTLGSSSHHPVVLILSGTVEKGVSDAGALLTGQVSAIETGGKLPDGADAVVSAEDCRVEDKRVIISHPVRRYENIIRKGEDYSRDEPVYPKGWIIRPQDIGVLASIGITRITVWKKPVIGIISTGKELVPSDSVPRSGEVREVNSYLISAFCKRQGAIPVRYGIVRDDASRLGRLVEQAAPECDAIIISGGSARDDHDVTAEVIRSLGEVYTDGITFAPEKRTTIGKINSVLIIGLPGHPSATYLVLSLVVIHLIQAMKGSPCQQVYRRQVTLSDHLHAFPDSDRYIRVKINGDTAIPVFGKAGLMNMLSLSDGIVRIPANSGGFRTGDRIEVMIW